MTIQDYFGGWSNVVDLAEANRIMQRLVISKTSLCPQPSEIFRAFRMCPLRKLRVIICGQDPYSDGKATGIAFANFPGTKEECYSPSLEVLKESIIDYTVPHRTIIFEPDLEKWEAQGVLMLNSALSCEYGRTGSHSLLWRPFMQSLFLNLSKHTSGIVYVLMGIQAQGYEPYINKQFNYVIKTRHPSYYARTKTKMPHSIWKEVNNILIGLNGQGIEWYEEY